MARKFKRTELQTIFEKYDGRCAYCGCELRKQEMQPDNIDGDNNDENIDSYVPSCFSCHRYKDSMNVNEFRSVLMSHLRMSCIDNFQARLAMKYGMIVVKKWDRKFFFEKQKQYGKENKER